ncbi:MAG: LPS-assembly protein LptD [Chromatiales bacterium]|nr:LPS-assembly protein LptD [Chromatiales bacterium]
MATAGAHGAQLSFNLCRAETLEAPALPPPTLDAAGKTLLRADEAHTDENDVVTLIGNVSAFRDDQLLYTDRAIYEQRHSRINAIGNVRYLRKGLMIEGERGNLSLNDDTGALDNADFMLFDRHGRGNARSVNIVDRDTTVLNDASYTTCDPGKEDWLLRASYVHLDRESGTGIAHHARLSFMGVPFLYVPWMSFSIDDQRQSGFLAPIIKSSSRNGAEILTPFYINIAPRYDARLTPRYMEKRGTMLDTELRYLNPHSAGILDFNYLRDDQLLGEKRHLLSYRHTAQPGAGFGLDIDYHRASDANYFRDFGNNLGLASITHLEQRAILTYQAENWNASARMQRYQTVDETIAPAQRPYRQAPALTLRSQLSETNFRPNYRLVGSYVDFRHDINLEGQRLEIQPGITLPMYALSGYVQPALTLRHTSYTLDVPPGQTSNLDYTLPVFNIDSGIFLERNARWGEREVIHTLEPRLYYLYVPYRNQEALPLFDTGIPDFNFTQLFRDNRFNGADRVGDANQLSAALVTRVIDAQNGRERMQAGIGQIFYFEDRRVQLNSSTETARRSDIVAEANAALTTTINLRADARRSEQNGRIDRAGLSLGYQPAPRSLINIAYRYREDTLEQTDLTLSWPLSERWHVVARHNYSLHDERTLDALAGVEYSSCCWRFRIVDRRYLNGVASNTTSEYNRSIYFQLEFIGLASLGDNLESLLERGILGN